MLIEVQTQSQLEGEKNVMKNRSRSAFLLSLGILFAAHSANALQFQTVSLGRSSGIVSRTPMTCPAWGCDGPEPVLLPTSLELITALPDGNWGSPEASLEVTDEGATLQLGCSTGLISSQILVEGGSFTANGTMIPDNGIIASIGSGGSSTNSVPVVFTGVVSGNTLELTVQGNTYELQLNSGLSPIICE
jgi:hypothetical protein